MILATITATLVLATRPCHNPATHACYDYPTRQIRLDPTAVTPYILTHEVGHHVYFNTLTDQERRDQAINDPAVRNEEAWADTYAACILGHGPKWLRTHGYGIRIGHARFWRICNFIRR